MLRSWFFLCCLWPLAVQISLAADLAETLQPLIDAHAGEVAVSLKNLKTGMAFEYRANEVMPTASLIKFPVLVELYRQFEVGKILVDRVVTLREEDQVPGSGILTEHFPPGTQLPITGAARLMIAFSDNTATNLVLDQVGLQAVVDTMRELGVPETRINGPVYKRESSIAPERSQKYGLGSTTAHEMLVLLERLQARELVSVAASEKMLKHLAACDDRTKLLRFLPKTIKAYHKTGAVANVRTDAGLIETKAGTIAMVVLTAKNKDSSWGDENAAEILCGKIGLAVHDHFNPATTSNEPEDRTLRLGVNGELVEALQRAINVRLEPSPGLSIDGDFGAMTESAVRRFQIAQGLAESGVVEPTTWAKLGPLQLGEEAVPSPDEVNRQVLLRDPADELVGPPFVSCRGWIVADGETGEQIGGLKQDERLDIASTTKMMTAWLVIQICEKDPQRYSEILTFSRRADETIGSSATVRVGESLSVEETLFGLMLPSGNDAAVALAEHFGNRLLETGTSQDADSSDALSGFVAAMNQEALRLDMKATHFENPHGLTHAEHRSSCSDLVKLARAALKSERFRSVVATRQHGSAVRSESGYVRNLVWKNTNQLLATEGYTGLKTGTTDAAGACLVSASQRGQQTLIVVVLGASGPAARYADARNLHRWGWQMQLLSTKQDEPR